MVMQSLTNISAIFLSLVKTDVCDFFGSFKHATEYNNKSKPLNNITEQKEKYHAV